MFYLLKLYGVTMTTAQLLTALPVNPNDSIKLALTHVRILHRVALATRGLSDRTGLSRDDHARMLGRDVLTAQQKLRGVVGATYVFPRVGI